MTYALQQWVSKHGITMNAFNDLMNILQPDVSTKSENTDMSEASLGNLLRLEAVKYDASLWRNNNGVCIDQSGRHIRYGLGNDSKKLNSKWKSSDYIGITPVTSTSAGQTFGVFTAIEVKRPDWKGLRPNNDREQGQFKFLTTVTSMGGIGAFIKNPDEYRKLIEKCQN